METHRDLLDAYWSVSEQEVNNTQLKSTDNGRGGNRTPCKTPGTNNYEHFSKGCKQPRLNKVYLNHAV